MAVEVISDLEWEDDTNNMKKDYSKLLENAPAHDSPEFIDYLRENNTVVMEDKDILIIENAKYHKPEKSWYTIFFKCPWVPFCNSFQANIGYLMREYHHWEWLKKSKDRQTVKRFHIHIYKP